MPDMDFDTIFRTDDSSRDRFLSRLFGIFSEDIVRIWCRDDRAPFLDLGRPTVLPDPADRGSTLDFTLQNRASGAKYVTEMKCELQYRDYRYLVLREPSQLRHHDKKAFHDFLAATRSPHEVSVSVAHGNSKRTVDVEGGILIWGSVTEQGRSSVVEQYGFADVLSLESIVRELNGWRNPEFLEFIEERRSWCEALFQGLLDIS